MAFEKEKELSKKLKKLKNSLGDASAVLRIIDKIKKSSPEIDNTRKNTNITHNEIQKLAAESQKMHETLIKNSKDVDELKNREKEEFKKFSHYKKQFNEANNKIQEKLGKLNEIREKINKFKLEEDEKRKLRETKVIQSKEQEIEEKIKSGKKLTTDDFLMFQEALKGKKV